MVPKISKGPNFTLELNFPFSENPFLESNSNDIFDNFEKFLYFNIKKLAFESKKPEEIGTKNF